jgi:hypothetical protein
MSISLKTVVVDRTVRSKNWQKPKENHPWRRYVTPVIVETIEVKKELITVKEFIDQLSSVDWCKYEVSLPTSFEGSSRHTLGTLPQEKQAAWICNMLKKYYVKF